VHVKIRFQSDWLLLALVWMDELGKSFRRPRRWLDSLGAAAVGLAMCAGTTGDVSAQPSRPIWLDPSVYQQVTMNTMGLDPRAERLERFFALYNCPEPRHVDEYLRAADTYGIDYRLLPAISVRETHCGLQAWQNNRWGYDPGAQGFHNVAEGIDYVSRQLAWGAYYRGKSLDEKLYTYNPLPAYPGEVRWIMRQID
jgi:hypothetical protein